MALNRPKYPAWVQNRSLVQAHPWDEPDALAGGQDYLMACTVAGESSVVLITWRARDRDDAEVTFQKWLDQDWGVLSKTFFNEPCRYVFRTGAVTGFVVLPD